jgi:hypothetical protein
MSPLKEPGADSTWPAGVDPKVLIPTPERVEFNMTSLATRRTRFRWWLAGLLRTVRLWHVLVAIPFVALPIAVLIHWAFS